MNPYLEEENQLDEGKMGEKAAGDLDFHPEPKLPPKAKEKKPMKKPIKEVKKGEVSELNIMTLSKYAAKARAASMDKDNPKRYKRGSGAAKAYDKISRGEYSEQSDICPVCGQTPCNCTSISEAVTVDKKNYSWGKMIMVHQGKDTSFPLHPEHQAAIKKLRPGMKTTFKDETGRQVHAHREGDQVHLTHHNTGSSTATKATVGYHHFDEGCMPDLMAKERQKKVVAKVMAARTKKDKLEEASRMSDDEYKRGVESYGARAAKLLKHSWDSHDASKEASKAGNKPEAEKLSNRGSRAHKLFLKAWKKHESKPGNREKAIQRTMSGASDYYKSKKPGEYTGD